MSWLNTHELLNVSVYSLVTCNVLMFWFVVYGFSHISEPFCDGHEKLRKLVDAMIFKSLFGCYAIVAILLWLNGSSIDFYFIIVYFLMLTTVLNLMVMYGIFVIKKAIASNVVETEPRDTSMSSVDPDLTLK